MIIKVFLISVFVGCIGFAGRSSRPLVFSGNVSGQNLLSFDVEAYDIPFEGCGFSMACCDESTRQIPRTQLDENI